MSVILCSNSSLSPLILMKQLCLGLHCEGRSEFSNIPQFLSFGRENAGNPRHVSDKGHIRLPHSCQILHQDSTPKI